MKMGIQKDFAELFSKKRLQIILVKKMLRLLSFPARSSFFLRHLRSDRRSQGGEGSRGHNSGESLL